MSLRIGIGKNLRITPSVDYWTQQYFILKSGAIWYKREINNAGGYFTLSYSNDSGGTWDELLKLDLTEDSVVIDLTHQYVHSIVGTSYQVATALGDILYST